MPSNRTKESVDRILEELNNEQTVRGVRDGVTDRQVDAILQTIGHSGSAADTDVSALGPISDDDLPDITLGKGQYSAPSDRFSTAVLDDLLGDLPSLRGAKKPQAPARQPQPAAQEAPRTAPRAKKAESEIPAQNIQSVNAEPAQPAASGTPARKPEPAERPAPPAEPQPAPAQDTGTGDVTGTGDTTLTSILAGLVQRNVPGGAQADRGAVRKGKEDFAKFFGKSVAVVPDENGRIHNPNKSRKGLFGLGRASDTDTFAPINVRVFGGTPQADEEEDTDGEAAEALPEAQVPPAPARQEAPAPADEPEPQPEPAPVPRRKHSLFAGLFGGRGRRGAQTDEPDYDEEIPEDEAQAESEPEAPAPVMTRQAEIDNLYRSDGPGDSVPTQTIHLPTATQAGLDMTGWQTAVQAAPESRPQEQPAQAQPQAPAQDPSKEQTQTLYRKKKRDTVEFTPRKDRPQTARLPAPERPRRETGPVGEPVMTSNWSVPPQDDVPPKRSGFTLRFDAERPPESTQAFLNGLSRITPPPAPMPQDKPEAQEAQPEAPSAREDTFEELPKDVAQTMTGQIRLSEIAAEGSEPAAPAQGPARQQMSESEFEEILGPVIEEKPDTAEFVRGIEQSINLSVPRQGTAADKDEQHYRAAAQFLTDPTAGGEKEPPKRGKAAKGIALPHFGGTPKDETAQEGEAPFAAAVPRRHEYENADDAPAVRRDLDQRTVTATAIAAIVGVAALVMVVLGTAALGGTLPGALDVTASPAPLLTVMLLLLAACMALCWQTMLGGLVGLVDFKRGSTADTMPALAALAAAVQCAVFLAKPEWYSPLRLCLLAGPAALLLCGNAAGKALDAHTVRDNFTLVSAGVDHAVAYRLKDAGVLQTVTAGLAEPRPNVLVSRPTRLLKNFLAGSASRRTSDKSQQQLARILLGCAAAAFLFTWLYRKNIGTAFTVLAGVLCFAAPLASTLISALPMRLMQRSAAQIGAVVPGWKDIRLLGRINVLQVSAQDLFPKGCVALRGIKPLRKEDIELSIIYSASMLADAKTPLRDIFLGMTGDNRKLLCKVENFETLDGLGYVGWINGDRVMLGSRRLMDTYDIKVPPLEYERRHTVNQRRVIYLAVAGRLFSMFQVAYQSDPDTAAVLESLRRAGLSLIVDCDDFNCDEALLRSAYNLPEGTVKVLSSREHRALEPAVAWLPESEGSMLHLGTFASFVGGMEAAAGAAEGEHKASSVLSASVLISCLIAMIIALGGGLAGLTPPVYVVYQAIWVVLSVIFPMIQRY